MLHGDNKVIDFSAAGAKRAAAIPRAYAELVAFVKQVSRDELATRMKYMFNNVDDCLFDLADKAGSNAQQTEYFDAMRVIRIRKLEMEQVFEREFVRRRDALLRGYDQEAGGKGALADEMVLVSHDEMEESLAIGNMVAKAYQLYHEPLHAVCKRLEVLLDHTAIDGEHNPVGPETICQAFKMAVQLLEVDLKIKLIVYKLFERLVMEHIGVLYDKINARLLEAGVLPRIKFKAHQSASLTQLPNQKNQHGAVQENEPQSGDHTGAQGDGMFESLRNLLHMQRGSAQHGASMGGGAGGAGFATGAMEGAGLGASAGGQGGVMLTLGDVLASLSSLQQRAVTDTATGPGGARMDVIGEIVKLQGGDVAPVMLPSETDAVDIVGMLFDYILGDPALPDRLKAIIGRLQIPMVKVALMDKEFFAHKHHPARLLLNELAYAHSDGDETIYDKVEHVVNRILLEFTTDMGLFADLHQEFSDFVGRERVQNEQIAEAREAVRDRVAYEIERRMTAWPLPRSVQTLLLVQWKAVLTMIAARDGCAGVAWETALLVADDLVWSVQPKPSAAERRRLGEMIPKLLQGLQEGLVLIASDAELRARIFGDLETLHLASLRQHVPSNANMKAPELDQAIATVTSQDFIDEIILEAATQSPEECSALRNSPYLESVRAMEIGTWVEFIGEGGKARRGKLVWKCEFTGDYTFVGRKYQVVADKSLVALAQDFAEERAFVIEDVPLFDRALDAVVNGLKKYVDGARESSPVPA